MTSSAQNRDDPQDLTRPIPEALARWLLADEIGDDQRSEDLVAAGERAYLKLRERLAILLGATGFDALWARAVHMAQREFCPADDPMAADKPLLAQASGLRAVLHGRSASAIRQNMVVAFARFIALLFTFIGAELGLRFIRQIWPTLSPDAEDATSWKAQKSRGYQSRMVSLR